MPPKPFVPGSPWSGSHITPSMSHSAGSANEIASYDSESPPCDSLSETPEEKPSHYASVFVGRYIHAIMIARHTHRLALTSVPTACPAILTKRSSPSRCQSIYRSMQRLKISRLFVTQRAASARLCSARLVPLCHPHRTKLTRTLMKNADAASDLIQKLQTQKPKPFMGRILRFEPARAFRTLLISYR